MDQDKLYELIDNIPVTQENAGLIEEIKEDIATKNYTAALEKIEMLGSKRIKKIVNKIEEVEEQEEQEMQEDKFYGEGEYDEEENQDQR